ncbi:acyl-CoA dehydrogenase family protein [Nocardia sp. NBC_00565]|uniref:acyl-CoA dehydrogenase family protein n=1 Tax=Nocardia sp. NBC_00565 TaxID=2975993 RepID=UPI002E80B969|nr:acyl-CoA dehydrogenase family protein [Nocardia sp. NBC_00565]WUC06614.1 acyl-CoA dehydrogenase family protein [Nocardia sp. NBC_00565]
MRLVPTRLTAEELDLQSDVRSYLDQRLPVGSYPLGLGMAATADPQFSRDLGSKGWLGMSLPKEYGGGGRSAVERLIVVEELLARGAPVGYHWTADRQSGANIAQNGTEEQKRAFIPAIARGELCFAIGMSEPDSGSDLASIKTRASRVDGGWLLNGTKVWTSYAGGADYILTLVRTSDDRHHGLTQFIVDTKTEGMTISPIEFLDGTWELNEVVFVDVFVPDSCRLGEVGAGWSQNTSELALERGGVDRWMSCMSILTHWAALQVDPSAGGHAVFDLGSIVARLWAFRGMSLSIARMVDVGESPVTEAALVKEMATRFEQDCVRTVVKHLGRAPDLMSEDPYESLLARAVLVSPSWTIRGGTTEVLRSVVAKGIKA